MEARTALRAAWLTCRTSKRRPSSPSNPLGREQVTSKRDWTVPLGVQEGRQRQRSGRTRKSPSYRARRMHSRFLGGMPWIIG